MFGWPLTDSLEIPEAGDISSETVAPELEAFPQAQNGEIGGPGDSRGIVRSARDMTYHFETERLSPFSDVDVCR
jgi:hypothetical protein